jgi:hypothetical protein
MLIPLNCKAEAAFNFFVFTICFGSFQYYGRDHCLLRFDKSDFTKLFPVLYEPLFGEDIMYGCFTLTFC